MGGTWGRRLGLGVLAVALFVTLVSANLIVGADRTVLDAEFVTETLESEGVYAVAVAEMETQLEARAQAEATLEEGGEREGEPAPGATGEFPGNSERGADVDRLLDRVVTPAYLQSQVETNVVGMYDYLHGREDELVLEVDLVPLKERLAPELAATFTADLSTVDPTLAAMAESEEAFRAERAAFTARQLERIQAETDEELSEAELRARYDERRPEIRAELLAEFEAAQENEETPEELDAAILGLAAVRVDGLVAPDATYESFQMDLDTARNDLDAAVETMLAAEIDESVPDTVDPAENMDPEATSTLASLRTGVQLIDTLTYVLPLLAFGLTAVIHWGTTRRSSTLLVVGGVTTVAGLGWIVGLTLAQQALTSEFEAFVAAGTVNPALVDALQGVTERLFGVFTTQSWLLVGLGSVFVGGGFGLRQGMLPVADLPPEADAGHGETNEERALASEERGTELEGYHGPESPDDPVE